MDDRLGGALELGSRHNATAGASAAGGIVRVQTPCGLIVTRHWAGPRISDYESGVVLNEKAGNRRCSSSSCEQVSAAGLHHGMCDLEGQAPEDFCKHPELAPIVASCFIRRLPSNGVTEINSVLLQLSG